MNSSLINWFEAATSERVALHDADMDLLEKLTIVIPSYQRHDFLLRQCVFWHGSRAKIILVDGSPDPLPADAVCTIAKSENIKYMHVPSSFASRLAHAAELIRTPYAVLGGDDEFMLPTGLRRAIDKLEVAPSITACIGQSLAFFVNQDTLNLSYGPGYPHSKYAIEHATPQERLTAALSNYTAATAYAVMRADSWKKSYGELREWSSPYASEMQQAISTYISGALATVEEVYWMRSVENRPVNTQTFNRGKSFQEWWASSKMKAEHTVFVEALGSELAKASHMNSDEAQAIIHKSIEVFIANLHHSAKKDDTSSFSTSVLRSICLFTVRLVKLVLPDGFIYRIKGALFGLRHGSGTGMFGCLSSLRDLDTSLFCKDEALFLELLDVERAVAEFYQSREATKR